ncbi:hypothetical protein [Aestuariivivens sediminis]|uniref:hypothetical protein n=1 Tax=Aestuariivivens sediminis TaxID=2913557 RepID=UPI001F57705A|nr:hypothetical protein [Aestuariivivens sediminis]
MTRDTNKILLIVLLFLGITSCIDDSKENKSTLNGASINTNDVQNLNISFLLDLSDRIDPEKYPNPSMEYFLRDVEYIKSVSEAFYTHLKRKKVRQMNDKIQMYFDPEPRNQNINSISEDLRFNVSRQNASLELLDEIKEFYAEKPIKIYELAIKDDKYVGSDTWRFFKTKVNDFCIEDGYRNILVILSDGYIYHKDTKIRQDNQTTYLTPQDIRAFKLDTNNWDEKMSTENYGFIPAAENLDNLEILVLGINPDTKNDFEEDVIMSYWSNWFNEMKVKRYEIKTAGLPSDMDKIIKDFILNK